MDVQPYTLGATDEEALAIWLLEKQISREKAKSKPSDDDYESEHRFLHAKVKARACAGLEEWTRRLRRVAFELIVMPFDWWFMSMAFIWGCAWCKHHGPGPAYRPARRNRARVVLGFLSTCHFQVAIPEHYPASIKKVTTGPEDGANCVHFQMGLWLHNDQAQTAERTEKLMVRLTPDERLKAESIGNWNASEGLRIALAAFSR